VSEHPATRWDVYRDAEGNPVTITEEQCAAIQHAVRVWAEVAEAEGYYHAPGIRALVEAFNRTVMQKSCLMGRMLYHGKRPYDEAPPVQYAAPAYWLWDEAS
jgi:2-hydroxychromene-2-carboxylate isomerase